MSEREQFGLASVRGPRSPGGIAIPMFSDVGFGTLALDHPLGGLLGIPAPWLWHTYFNDFDDLAAFNGITDTASWDVTTVGTTPTFALADGENGLGLITLSNTDNDHVFYQKKGESFLYTAGKPLLFAVRFKTVEVLQCDIVAGLMITDATPLATVTDGIWFQKDDGDALIDFHVAKDSAGTDTTSVATLVNNTFISLCFAYDGGTKIRYGVNGALVGTVALTGAPDNEELAVTFGIQAGEGTNVKTMHIDYIFASAYTGRS